MRNPAPTLAPGEPAASRRRPRLSAAAGIAALAALSVQTAIAGAQGVAERPAEPSVFGTVALPAGTTPTSARWTRLVAARSDHPTLTRLAATASRLNPEQQAAFVHETVNRTVHRRSRAECRQDDGYWAAAEQTLARATGDCVDIAVAKMEALRRIGFAARDLYLTTGRMAASGPKTALLVRIGDRFWLLDDRSDEMIPADRPAAFDPSLTYGFGMTWAHGRRLSSARRTG